jgi:RNA polymerase sigma factor (sigma-70 family)
VSALVEPRADSADDPPAGAVQDTEVALADEQPVADGHPADSGDAARTELPVEEEPDPPPVNLRIDFGAHFESNYQRLVAQLYAITLDAGQAHDAVQDAYARAWRRWATVGRTPDPSAWVRSVAVRSTIRSWRSVFGRLGVGAPRADQDNIEPRTRAMLSALRRLPATERRALVLTYLAGCSVEEIAAIEQVSYNTVQARLSRGRRLITENLADDLPVVLGRPARFGELDRDDQQLGEPAWADRDRRSRGE